ncbi:MAG: diaminopimelate decarboxylase [Paraprevotella sp.]|nr:diaminopimelate decarboxylase [Paraprevotella sp.]MDY5265713.1 diaminopimelate decarboxylase [Bacteroidaceae bacterium]
MSSNQFPIESFRNIKTPFYYYDTALLRQTIKTITDEVAKHEGYHIHYAVKACANPKVLRIIADSGLGADCVSGGEIQACIDAGFPANTIVYAGVGKADWEIELGLNVGIQYFNVESVAELEVIEEIAARMNKTANVSFRINPDVGAHTHANITTGLSENKFGIAMQDMERVILMAKEMPHIEFVGLHFHIGSQILEMDDFQALALRINELQDRLEKNGIGPVKNINVGGGLGIDYQEPDAHPVPGFGKFFDTYAQNLKLRPGQQLHFELGRSIVGQCGSLIAKCLYVKQATHRQFVILDAGMTDLIRPALYDAHHHIENLTSQEANTQSYDVVGPICESSDVFQRDCTLPVTHRGDLIALRSAGAYGEIMASQYNCRPLPIGYVTEDFQ